MSDYKDADPEMYRDSAPQDAPSVQERIDAFKRDWAQCEGGTMYHDAMRIFESLNAEVAEKDDFFRDYSLKAGDEFTKLKFENSDLREQLSTLQSEREELIEALGNLHSRSCPCTAFGREEWCDWQNLLARLKAGKET